MKDPPEEDAMPRSRGPIRAVVEDGDDPLRRGRLLVSAPSAGITRAWAEACLPPVPVALVAIPAPGSTVWVELEDGDRARPVWVGVTWDAVPSAAPRITSASSLTLRSPVVHVESGAADFTGVVRCQTLIAEAVISSSYTPGAGNIA
jgi:hypothetical protein